MEQPVANPPRSKKEVLCDLSNVASVGLFQASDIGRSYQKRLQEDTEEVVAFLSDSPEITQDDLYRLKLCSSLLFEIGVVCQIGSVAMSSNPILSRIHDIVSNAQEAIGLVEDNASVHLTVNHKELLEKMRWLKRTPISILFDLGCNIELTTEYLKQREIDPELVLEVEQLSRARETLRQKLVDKLCKHMD